MTMRKEIDPYPAYLYRYMVPRPDSPSRPTADIGSDAYESSFLPMPIGKAHTDGTVGAFYKELERQLSKYQTKLLSRVSAKHNTGTETGPPLPPSALVSLSGDFRWTVQKACKIYRASSESIVPGVAVFETACAKDVDCFLYRVADLIDWFDSRYGDEQEDPSSSELATFSADIRYWANNAHEFVVWSHVPRAALVSYVPVSTLAPPGQLNFLTQNFRRAKDLANVRARRWVKMSPRRYWELAVDFLTLFIAGMRHDLLVENPTRLQLDILVQTLTCPRQWGFLLCPSNSAISKRYMPSMSRLTAFIESMPLSEDWVSRMRAVEFLFQEAVLDGVNATRKIRGREHKNCPKCQPLIISL